MITLVLLLLVSSPVRAEEINGQNYHLTVPSRFAPFVAPLKKFLDQSERSYVGFFEGLGLRRQRVTLLFVKAFGSHAEYDQARKKTAMTVAFVPGAFYSSTEKTAYLFDQGDMRMTLASLLHEVSHHYVRDFIPDGKILSTCLNEGLAESVDSSPLQASGMRIDPDLHLGWGRMMHQAAQNKQLLPLDRLIAMETRQFQSLSARTGHLPYAQCWTFVRFLMTAERGRLRPVLVALLTKAEPKVRVYDLISQALPTDISLVQFDERWEEFASNPH